MKGVKDALSRLDGVSTVQVDLQANLVHITPSATVALPLAEVPGAIRAAGFVPGDMTIQAQGTFEGDRFRIRGWSEPLTVRSAAAAAAPPTGEVSLTARVDYSGDSVVLEPRP